MADEEYGPNLVRLGKSEQRTILDLISENRGREARSEITRLTESRLSVARAKRAIPTSVRDYVPPAGRNVDARIGTDYGKYVSAARSALTRGELPGSAYQPVSVASAETIRFKAREAAHEQRGYSEWYYHY